jgi:hemerythrin-like metal-binding protein
MSSFIWNPSFALGLEPMDRTHREFVDLCNALAAAPNEAMLPTLDALICHTQAHFEQENHWMEGCSFPPVAIHMGEHERVLRLLRQARAEVAAGDPGSGRRLAAELPDWFRGHAATMDAALAHWIRVTGHDAKAGEPLHA